MEPITVLLAEDHQVVREGLRSLLAKHADISLVGEAATGREAVALTRQLRPAVVLMDIAMPELNGLEATRRILKACPGTRVLILSAYSDAAYAEEAVALGAAGYLNKQTSAQILATAIREVQQGNQFFCPSTTQRRRSRGSRPESPTRARSARKPIGGLSPRELEVLQLIAEGHSSPCIGKELGISSKTVDVHRSHIIMKLELKGIADLTRYAIAEGLIECNVRLTVA
jgi:DNA-binding NarL/FixJ family response regulator